MKTRKIDWDRFHFYRKTKKLEIVVDVLEIIYFVFRHHTIGIFGAVFGIAFFYYGLFIEQISGVWMFICAFAGMFIASLCVAYSLQRSYGI